MKYERRSCTRCQHDRAIHRIAGFQNRRLLFGSCRMRGCQCIAFAEPRSEPATPTAETRSLPYAPGIDLKPLALALGIEFEYQWHLSRCAACRRFIDAYPALNDRFNRAMWCVERGYMSP